LGGIEWLVEAYDCDPERLKNPSVLQGFFQFLVVELQLKPVGEALWHQFPNTCGLTGLLMLQESHLAIHTFPEHQSACLNLFCCRNRNCPDWQGLLPEWLGARQVHVEEWERNYVLSELPILRS
jgi:S-adenosylmethionine decarboxylase